MTKIHFANKSQAMAWLAATKHQPINVAFFSAIEFESPCGKRVHFKEYLSGRAVVYYREG